MSSSEGRRNMVAPQVTLPSQLSSLSNLFSY